MPIGGGFGSGNYATLAKERLNAQISRGVPCTDMTYVSAPEAVALGSAAGTSWMRHTVHTAGVGFWVVMTNKRMNQGTTSPNYSDADPAAALPVKAYWKIKTAPSGVNVGATGACRFNGIVNATIDPSGELRSDFVPIPLEVGAVVEFRVYTTSTSWAPNMQSLHSGQSMGFVTGDQTATGGDLAASFGSLIQPAMILAKPPANSAAPAVAFGAASMSIDDGQGDDFSLSTGFNTKPLLVPAQGSGGHLARAAKAAGIPFVSFSLPGDQVVNFVTASKRYARSTLLSYLTDVVIPNPTNDIAQNAYTLAQIQANVVTAIGQLGAAGFGLRLWAGTVTPRSTSTDQWQTTTNQGVVSSNTENIRVAYNTWLRDGAPMHASGASWVADTTGTATGTTVARCAVYGATGALVTAASGPTHPVAGVFDTAATVESALNSGKWAAGVALTGITTTAASQAITAAAAAFDSTMIGGIIVIPGAAAAGATLVTTITTVSSTTAATVATAATTAVTAVPATAKVLTSDGLHPDPYAHALMAAAVPVAAIAVPA